MPRDKELPHPADVLILRDWVMAGCPAASRDHNAKACAATLLDVLKALPKLDPLYRYGSRENEKAMSDAAIIERCARVDPEDGNG